MFEDNPGFMPDYSKPISFQEQIQAATDLGGKALSFTGGVVRQIPGFFSDLRESFRPENQKKPSEGILGLADTAEAAENTLSDVVATGIESGLGKLGVPESISKPIAGFGGAALTPGINDLKIAGGVATLPLTAMLSSHPALKGLARRGIAETPEYAPGIAKLRAEQSLVQQRTDKFLQEFAEGKIDRSTLKERLSKVKKRSDAKFSTLATPDDPDIFESPRFKNPDPTDPQYVADQHHAFAKSMTSPVVRKALEVTDDDDNIVALFNLHKALTGSGMGNVRSGMIDMPGAFHDTAKAAKRGQDPKLAFHSISKKSGAGFEIRSDKVEEMFKDVTTFDELVDKYIVFADEYLIPQKEIAVKRVRQQLANFRDTIPPGPRRNDFDLMVKRLNMANTK